MALNDPAGSTQLVNHSFNDFSAFYFGSASIVSDATAPTSPPNCMQSTLAARAAHGGTQINLSIGAPRRDMYCRLSWRTNAGFQGRVAQDKLFFMRGPDSNGFFGLLGGPTKGGSFRFYFGHNSGNVNNAHTMSGDLGLIGHPNVGSGVITAGSWTTLEAYIKASSTYTSRDGIVKWWVNGFPAGSYTNINYGPAGLNEWIWTETWDGCGNNGADCDIGPSARGVNTVEWYHRVDHLYISSGGTLVDGGGGPEPEPEPEPQVVLQSLTPANASTVIGTTRQFTISMSGPVQTATSLFTTSSVPSVATVPASVTIAQGASTVLVPATPVAIGSTTISTSYNGVTKGATLQVGTGGTTTGSTVYDYSTQFSGVQGQDNWYYLEHDGTEMTYNGGTQIWTGSDTTGGSVQLIWGTGFHPGGIRATILRFVVPDSGSADIVGNFNDLDSGGGTGCVARVNHNGLTLFTRSIANGQTTGGDYSLEDVPVVAGDHIDFVVTNQTGDYSFNSTTLDPVITLAATSTIPNPPPPPPPPVTVVDLFTTAATIVVDIPFTMTVRVSQVVTIDTTVEIRVGSTSILTAPASVTVLTGNSEVTMTVTPLAASLVAIEAVLNGTKRVTLNVLPAVIDPGTIDPGPGTNPDQPPTITLTVTQNGARLIMAQPARALEFRYDAHPDYIPIPDYPAGDLTYTHAFTWPSGTTTVCYRAKSLEGDWAEATCAPYVAPIPPIPKPPVIKSIVDKEDVRWQLTGKRSPYTLKRNGSSMNNTYGLTLRKSSDGYMEILQTNNVWLRRNGDAWEFVT